MSSPYREPDQWALQHKAGIQITAAVVGLISVSVMFYPTSQQLSTYAVLVGFTDLMLYSWLSEKWNPNPKDWLQFIYAKAAATDQATWLLETEAEFNELWNLGTDSDLMEALFDE